MKRTDKERIERELKRKEKREKVGSRREGEGPPTVGSYIKELKGLLRFDDQIVYNAVDDEEILELLENMKDDLPEAKWDTVIRKAVKSTKVIETELAYTQLRSLME